MQPTQSTRTPLVLDANAAPWIVLIGADGKRVADDATEFTAVLLPDYGLLYDFRFPEAEYTQKQALAAAKKCNLFGERDWMLTSRKEEELLIDPSAVGPATYPQLRAKTPPSGWVWTRTEHPSSSDGAIYVSLHGGYVCWLSRGNRGRARFVRLVPASQLSGFLA
ncbi:MAG: DUF1566 domain-containing protein [Nevskiaceae bacterium]|nr:MAG: DUF1566 domain-containing protein [Nevskiaceae bacterium]